MKAPSLITSLAASALLAACNTRPAYDATGIFEATTVTVSAETAGRIVDFAPAEGDTVVRGASVALIDTTVPALQLRELESRRRAAESSSPDIAAQAADLRSQIAHAEQEAARQKRLMADGATTQKACDDADAQLRTLRSRLAGLLSSLVKSSTSIADNALALQYQADQAAEQIARSRITAPATGTILVKYAQPGEYATPGRPLFKMADLGDIYLRSYFTAGQLASVRLGQKVTVIADFGGGEQYEYPGTVTWIADESEFTPKSIQTEDSRASLVYAVKVAVRNDGRLKLGQYGEVRL